MGLDQRVEGSEKKEGILERLDETEQQCGCWDGRLLGVRSHELTFRWWNSPLLGAGGLLPPAAGILSACLASPPPSGDVLTTALNQLGNVVPN